MRCNLLAWWAFLFLIAASGGPLWAEVHGELLANKTAWEQAPRNFNSDLVRFQDRWLMVCVESQEANKGDDTLRVLSSTDGEKWSSLARLESPTPERGLYGPKFNLRPDGKLVVSAVGILPDPYLPKPLPRYGGTTFTLGWESKDGAQWNTLGAIGQEYYPLSRMAWHKGVAYSYSHGTICGSSQTVIVFSSKTGHEFLPTYEETFSGFFPEEGALVFQGDQAFCLMSCINAEIDNAPRQAMLGTSKHPFGTWKWKEIEPKLSHPNLLQLSDKQVIAAVTLHGPKTRLVLGELNLETGKLREFLEIPTEGRAKQVGLAHHKGELLVSYHAIAGDNLIVKVARVKLTER